MGTEGKGTIFKRKDDRYLLYLPVRIVDDSMFPLKCDGSMPVKVCFSPNDGRLIVEKWSDKEKKTPSRYRVITRHLPFIYAYTSVN